MMFSAPGCYGRGGALRVMCPACDYFLPCLHLTLPFRAWVVPAWRVFDMLLDWHCRCNLFVWAWPLIVSAVFVWVGAVKWFGR
jgi:hypothetical protein